MPAAYRHTKIIFTIGPATESEEVLIELIRNGVDICRLNMAHADHSWTRTVVARIRQACEKAGRQIAILMDVKGPEIRTGTVPYTFNLAKGEMVDFYYKGPVPKNTDDPTRAVSVNYPGIARNLKEGDTILVDSGLIRLRVESIDEEKIRSSVLIPGPLGNRRHINLPGIKVDLPALTAKDHADVKLGVELGIDFFALSFVREPDDLDILRRTITEQDSQARIIAKIEDQTAISNMADIIRASDGLMVARGDLGIEIPYETLPLIQRRAVEICHKIGRPVIIATHMLESMIESPMPTRAEITDIANAVFEQADCVMLSGETTVGKYPVECVDVLKRIIESIESSPARERTVTFDPRTPKGKILQAASQLADTLEGAPIIVFTHSGLLARKLSNMRPRRCPIYAFTDVPEVFRHLLIQWGVEPFLIEFSADPEQSIQNAFKVMKEQKWARPGDPLVVVTTVLAGEQMVDAIQLRQIGDE